jgi:hypothetical protein
LPTTSKRVATATSTSSFSIAETGHYVVIQTSRQQRLFGGVATRPTQLTCRPTVPRRSSAGLLMSAVSSGSAIGHLITRPVMACARACLPTCSSYRVSSSPREAKSPGPGSARRRAGCMSERLIRSLQLAFHTMEAMRRQLASQLGQYGLHEPRHLAHRWVPGEISMSPIAWTSARQPRPVARA